MNTWDIINKAEQSMGEPSIMRYSNDIEKLLAESKKEYDNEAENISGIAEQALLDKVIRNAGGIRDIQTMDEIKVIRCNTYGKFIVTDSQNNIIVPLGRYSFIDPLDYGYLRVNVEDENGIKHWGIINSQGKEVVPLCYDRIWSYNVGHNEVTLFKKYELSYFNLMTGNFDNDTPPLKQNSREDYISEEERRQMERDSFYALTDGAYGDYEDYCDSGYNEDNIRDYMGLD